MKQSEAQKRANKKYKSGLRYKQVVFYKHEQELADFADSINFQGLIKDILCHLDKNSLIYIANKTGPYTSVIQYYFNVKNYLKGGD